MKFGLTLVAASMILAGSAMAASTFSSPMNASAFLNDGSVSLNVTVLDANLDCGTLDYSAASPIAAGAACPSGAPISTGHAAISGNVGLTPFYVTVTDDFTSAPDRVILSNAGGATFGLNLAVSIDGAAYTTGSYKTPQGGTSDIIITPTTRDTLNTQAAGRYVGTFTFFLSF